MTLRRALRVSICAFLPALGACHASPAPATDAPTLAPAPVAAPARQSYGAALDGQAEHVTLADLLREPARYADKTVRTEGTVTSVCQGRGCWLEIGDDASAAHVKLQGHRFFVPRTSSGRHAEVQARVLPVADNGHCEQEAVEQTGKVAKVELEATGVELF